MMLNNMVIRFLTIKVKSMFKWEIPMSDDR